MSEQMVKNQNNTDVDKSHDTDSKVTDTPHQFAVALDAISLGSDECQIHSPIFKLINDCWELIFDWLSLEELHSFGRTCKHFQRLTGEYFKWKYQNVKCSLNNHNYRNVDFGVNDSNVRFEYIDGKELVGFIPFIQILMLCNLKLDASFRYVVENIKSIKSMSFWNARFVDLDLKMMKNSLSSVEVVKFLTTCNLDGTFFETFLKLCVKLKRLTIDTNAGNTWLLHKYPTLKYLKLTHCDTLVNGELTTFFQQNPNVRSFSTTEKILMQHRDSFIANNIELDDLTILGVDDMNEFCVVMNDLYRRGVYKRLHLKTATTECLENLPGLVTLHIDTYDYVEMPKLDGVTELVFQPHNNGPACRMNMEEVSMNLKNLERIFTPETNEEYMNAFIRNSAKLKEIKTDAISQYGDYGRFYERINVVAMNNERKKLNGAHKVTIYLEEKDYLAKDHEERDYFFIKWKHNKTDFGLIEVKRKESYEGVWDHTFGRY
ncbi:uncharacterized protein LOC116340070 [Contarinia nasturtii]|uniref:uncharacterized protein LOC116340070 n=1 Tax=Contarinia nasturtii TaxID=265458 RepID=UPI0012D3E9FC|nr:uncharacterized protein LOC116340070 [Contarinia nasturtii]XP_031622129.1 uncharacterized protein LOC116340070 [Contarinia nasturtii]XP_031622138.1 uncharacterized protein LOC116340070 [Contarinia nasturtii]